MTKAAAIILAAGQGKRMRSNLAKVLHPVAGRPMVSHAVKNVQDAGFEVVHVVIGHQGEAVRQILPDISCIEQREQLGTGHAVDQCREALREFSGPIVVTYGDTPLFRAETFANLVKYHQETESAATILTTQVTDPSGYGRIIRSSTGEVERIVEHKDAQDSERKICEINTGTYCFDAEHLFRCLKSVTPHNAQGEYYLPDVIPMLVTDGLKVSGCILDDPQECMGINDRVQLAQAEGIMRLRICERWMIAGVTIIDPMTTYIDDDCAIGQDTVIYPMSFLRSGTRVGEDCQIGPNVVLADCTIGRETTIGPFAYIRPGTKVGDCCKIGDFVELKNSEVGNNSKIPHHAYVGDALVGSGVNVSCGVITCNYDGKHKHKTIMEDNSFVGSNSSLVAPVRIGKGAYVAAGSTITEDVPDDNLGIARGRQVNKEGWKKRRVTGDHQSK